MGTVKRDGVDLGRDQKNMPQHGTGVAGANKPRHEDKPSWALESTGLTELRSGQSPQHRSTTALWKQGQRCWGSAVF